MRIGQSGPSYKYTTVSANLKVLRQEDLHLPFLGPLYPLGFNKNNCHCTEKTVGRAGLIQAFKLRKIKYVI